MWWDGERAYAYAYQYSKTMTPDQAAFVIQQAWRTHKFHYDYCDYEDDISFYDLYPDRPIDYEGMSQVNYAYEYWQWYPTQGMSQKSTLNIHMNIDNAIQPRGFAPGPPRLRRDRLILQPPPHKP